MKIRKIQTAEKKRQRKYAKRISLYPLKPEEALSAFMKVSPQKIKKRGGWNKGGS